MVTSYSYLGSIVLKGLGYTLTTPIIIILDTGSVERGGFVIKYRVILKTGEAVAHPKSWLTYRQRRFIDPSSKGVPDTAIVIKMLNSYSIRKTTAEK